MSTWVLVLAAGDGRRLNGVSRDLLGRPAPKQYSDFGTGRTLLARTLDRALGLAPLERVVTVVAAQHAVWWKEALAILPESNVIVQPLNRGTAAGILLPLLHIAARDRDATVVVLPSDHHLEDESTVQHSVHDALAELRVHPGSLVLLGMTPEQPDTEYGWVLPSGVAARGARPVHAFVEKPGPLEAARLLAGGALWNSFMFAGRVATLLELFHARMPALLEAMASALRGAAGGDAAPLQCLYDALEVRDFSREVLQTSPQRLRVLRVPGCGWSDLGTPDRLARVLETLEVPLLRPAVLPAA